MTLPAPSPPLARAPSAAVEGERYKLSDGVVVTVARVDATGCYATAPVSPHWRRYGLWLCNVAERVE